MSLAARSPLLEGADAILHAGDITSLELLDELGAIAPVHAVAGNMDSETTLSTLGERRVLELGGHRVGLIHGWGAPGISRHGWWSASAARAAGSRSR